jgi:acid phosphatase class B
MPTTREGVLEMALTWIRVMADKLEAWGIPQAVRTELIALHRAAQDAYELVGSKATRTPAVVVACREAFRVLKVKMRDVKTDFAEPRINHMVRRLRRFSQIKKDFSTEICAASAQSVKSVDR